MNLRSRIFIQSWIRGRKLTTLGSDETSFTQGNGDAQNPTKKQGWLWVLVTPSVHAQAPTAAATDWAGIFWLLLRI
ncbi:MAG: hypothetical protein MUC48_25490 [Leptolyngbya sp. Prado105]|nr:hypothetical protein [Leptolyngbya sp. Prado105]